MSDAPSLAGVLRVLRSGFARGLGINWLARRRLDGHRIVILNYHRVLPREVAERDAVEEPMFVTPESFRTHLALLRTHFRVLPLHEAARLLVRGERLPQRACAITFDDGWRDNFDHAWPELRRAGLPATIFAVAERVGTLGAFWPDEVRRSWPSAESGIRASVVRGLDLPTDATADAVLARLKDLAPADRDRRLVQLEAGRGSPTRELMTWDELTALQADGIDIESHGCSHAILTGLSDDEARRELARSREILEARGLCRHRLFAYPSGRFDARIERLAGEAGYAAAFTLVGALASHRSDRLRIPRLGIHDGMGRTGPEFLYKVPGLGPDPSETS